ncbi:MAG: uL30 family ribosomal protein, partial [Candidatus Micrarchaeia archaeon]
TKPDIRYTLKLLKLTRVNHCVVFGDVKKVEKMLDIVKDYVTWGEISKEMLTKLVERRGRLQGNKPIPKDAVESVVSALEKGKSANIKPVFRLHPPRKGFKDKKSRYPQGDLGYRGKTIEELLNRMM